MIVCNSVTKEDVNEFISFGSDRNNRGYKRNWVFDN